MNEKKTNSIDTNHTSNPLKPDKNAKMEIDYLKEEINSIKEINTKTKDYLLLEFQSKLDQYEYKQNNLLLKTKEKLISKLNDENEYLKKQISDKEYLNRLISEKKIKELEDESRKKLTKKDNTIEESEIKISELTTNILELKHEKNRLNETLANKDSINTNLILKLKENEKIIRDNEKKIDKITYNNFRLEKEIKKINELLTDKDDTNTNLTLKLKEKDDVIHNKDTKINEITTNISDLKNEIKNINNELTNKNHTIRDKENKINELTTNIIKLNEKTTELITENDNILKKSNEKIKNIETKHDTLLNELISLKDELSDLKSKMILKENDLNNEILRHRETENHLNLIKKEYLHQLSKLDTNRYFINCNKKEIENKDLEIEYLKNNNLVKGLMNPISYVYLILKSNPHEISINLKLYKALKNSDYFDIGHYLKNNEDIRKSKWCRYFSPQLHYVCIGFDEKREINDQYLKNISKEELLNYLKNIP